MVLRHQQIDRQHRQTEVTGGVPGAAGRCRIHKNRVTPDRTPKRLETTVHPKTNQTGREQAEQNAPERLQLEKPHRRFRIRRSGLSLDTFPNGEAADE